MNIRQNEVRVYLWKEIQSNKSNLQRGSTSHWPFDDSPVTSEWTKTNIYQFLVLKAIDSRGFEPKRINNHEEIRKETDLGFSGIFFRFENQTVLRRFGGNGYGIWGEGELRIIWRSFEGVWMWAAGDGSSGVAAKVRWWRRCIIEMVLGFEGGDGG